MYIGAYYRPHENDEDSLIELKQSLDLVTKKKGTIWLIGDMNFPSLTWNDCIPSVKQSCSYRNIYETFLGIFDDFSLTQMVTQPTRFDNILDLFLTTMIHLLMKFSQTLLSVIIQ